MTCMDFVRRMIFPNWKWKMHDILIQRSGDTNLEITKKHYYPVYCFNDIIDSRFNETNFQLLVCLAAFNPRAYFHGFIVDNLLSQAKLYPHDFDSKDLRDLSHQLGLCIFDVRYDDVFSNLQTIAELSPKKC